MEAVAVAPILEHLPRTALRSSVAALLPVSAASTSTASVINAVEIERRDADEIRIVSALESFDRTAMSVDLLGIEFDLTAASFEDDDGNSLSANAFFDALVAGEFIKIKDNDSNMAFDKAELDD